MAVFEEGVPSAQKMKYSFFLCFVVLGQVRFLITRVPM